MKGTPWGSTLFYCRRIRLWCLRLRYPGDRHDSVTLGDHVTYRSARAAFDAHVRLVTEYLAG